MKVQVVIGANLGDEGKGHITNFYARQYPKSKGVRFCGGAQAGHTVQANGVRTVFHHFGSGSVAGAPTYLGMDFILNPIMFNQEYEELRDSGNLTPIAFNPLCLVTTPFDMIINQLLESSRGDKRHGSCGVGINETVVRDKYLPLRGADLTTTNPSQLREKVLRIQNDYFPIRVAELRINPRDVDELLPKGLDSITELFLLECAVMVNRCEYYTEKLLGEGMDAIIFEGAQGLLLDQNHRFFPYVTRANTGLTNVLPMVDRMGITEIDVTYVTRAYMTRHGAGPFPTEQHYGVSYEDKTNVHNDWQGPLRFGHLDVDLLMESISNDVALAVPYGIKINKTLCVTCIDQVAGRVDYLMDATWHENKSIHFLAKLAAKWDGGLMASYGPDTNDITTLYRG